MNKTSEPKPQATHKINSALGLAVHCYCQKRNSKKTFKRQITHLNLNSTTYRYTAKFGFIEMNLKCVCIKIFILNAPIKYHLPTPFLLESIKKKEWLLKKAKYE